MSDFNAVARNYDFFKRIVFGRQLERATHYFLHQLVPNSKLLVIGGGTGQLLSNFSSAHQVIFIELSSIMIKKATKVHTVAHVEFVQADILEWTTSEKFDYICTPFVLDCFSEEQLNHLFPKLKNMLKKQGRWLQTDFYPKNYLQKLLTKIMYLFFNLSANLKTNKLADFDALFEKHKFKCESKGLFYHSMVESKIYHQIE